MTTKMPSPEESVKTRRQSNPKVSQKSFARFAYLMPLLLIVFALGFLTALMLPVNSGQVPSETAAFPHTPVPIQETPQKLPTPTPNAQMNGNPLPSLYIEIAADDFDRIKAKREQALVQWILIASDADFVPATIRLGSGTPLPVKLRLKGDWADHFVGDKWSYRVQILGDQSLFGMRVFSLQAPSTRSYLNEWLFLDSLRQEDILAVRYSFVNIIQNGVDMGVYAIEEGFSKELFESLGRREGLIIRYNEDLLWRFWAGFENDLSTPRGVTDFHIIDDFQTNKINSDNQLTQQRDTAIGQLRGLWNELLPSSEVIDTETTAKFLALTDVWGAKHALQWHNLRYYYNPITTKLEPIAFDTQALGDGAWVELKLLQGVRQTISLDDPQIQHDYIQALWNYSGSEYLEKLKTSYETSFHDYHTALEPEYGSDVTDEGLGAITAPWDILETRQHALRELLNPLQMAYAYVPADPPSDHLSIDIGNLLDFPLEIVGVHINNTFIPTELDWIAQDSTNLMVPVNITAGALIMKPLRLEAQHIQYAHFTIPSLPNGVAESLSTSTIQLETRIWGLTQTITQPVITSYPNIYSNGTLPETPSLAEALAQHPYLEADETNKMVTIQPGTWEIYEDLILPDGYGLNITAGTTLKFDTGILLLSTGPLQFEGTENAPIMLSAIQDDWSGIVVLNADTSSHWSHVIINATDTVEREGWTLTGGATFYNSPINISHCIFQDTQGEDALNIVRTQFAIEDTTFSSTQSDAFDGDFTQGSVKNSRFINITGDGIDISGSDVIIENLTMQNLGDKGVSVGESSRLSGSDLVITGAVFGIVSKDLSQVSLSQITLADIHVAGLAAYQKKPEFGPATLEAEGVRFIEMDSDRYTLVQSGSWIDLEQQRIWGSDIDIDALYIW